MGHKNVEDRKAWHRSRRIEANKQMALLKSNPCVDCGGSFPHYVMEWDHVPERGEKIRCVASLMTGRVISSPTIQKEIQKCDLVCANCHKIRTHIRDNGSVV